MTLFKKTGLLWKTVFVFTLLVYFAGLFVTLINPDAAVYAITSMEMYISGNYLEIFLKGTDWLDKPHFQFWVTALSYSAFGISTIAYKLAALFFSLLAILYTYLFGCRFYSKKHGFLAALFLMTAQHIITSNMDVRAEPYLTGLTIMALFHFAVYFENKKFIHFIIGCAGLGCLIMTKGLFTIIPVAAGIGGAFLYKLKWKEIFHWQWLVAIVLILLFISPALYGYYMQFDQHPEKEIFGRHAVSGVEFFLWTSQWGRFMNTGPIKGTGDPFFFVHTLLWAFAPWAILSFFALFQKAKQLFRKIQSTEHYTFFGFIVMFLLFSASRFQLAHYLNPVFPMLSIITASFFLSILKKKKMLKFFTAVQVFFCALLILIIVLLQYYFSGESLHTDTLVLLSLALIWAGYLFFQKGNWAKKIIFGSALILLASDYYLNREFYPKLLSYQAESAMANYYKENNLPTDQLVSVDERFLNTDLVLQKTSVDYRTEDVSQHLLSGKYVFTSEKGLHVLDSLGIKNQLIRTFDNYSIANLKMKFINRYTRQEVLTKRYLIKIDGKE